MQGFCGKSVGDRRPNGCGIKCLHFLRWQWGATHLQNQAVSLLWREQPPLRKAGGRDAQKGEDSGPQLGVWGNTNDKVGERDGISTA